MTRPQWWDWCAAARDLATSAGEYATAMSWASLCWDWRRGSQSDDDRARPMRLADLADCIPGRPDVRTVQRHLAAMVAAGLLEVIGANAPGRPKCYAPVFLANTGHEGPVFAGNTGHQSPVSSGNTGHQRPAHRTSASPTQFSPEVPDSPLAPARTHTHTREDAPTMGGRPPAENNPDTEHVAALLTALDLRLPGTSSRVAPGYRAQLGRGFAALEVVGWRPADVIDRLAEGSLRGVGSPGAVLVKRLADLASMPPPATAADRHADRQATQTRHPCDHGTPGGCSSCFMCRRQQPDEDGVRCAQCAPDDLVGPPGNTAPLFPITPPEGTTS